MSNDAKSMFNWAIRNISLIVRAVEVVGILVGIFVVIWEFRVEKPIDRAVRNAQLIAQIETLASINRQDNADAGVRAVMELMASDGATMAGLSVRGVTLGEANLSGANLSGARLSDAYLMAVNLSKADLSGAFLSEASLNHANLSGANLGGAFLTLANLSGANLTEASLRMAYLNGANLIEADLSGAVLWGADLNLAKLSGAKLSGADLSGANLREVKGLTQEQLDSICTMEGSSPKNLPEGLEWHNNPCPDD